MNTQDLKIFEAVARMGSFTKAAKEMYTVQSNVTARIKVLEKEFGKALFTRNNKQVVLTEAGKQLLPYVKKIEVLLENAKSCVMSEPIKGTIHIGSLETTAALRLPPLIAAYSKKYKEVKLHLTTKTTDELVNEVLSFKLDGAFVAGPIANEELSHVEVVEEELVVVSDSRTNLKILSKQQNIRVIVFKSGCSYRKRLEILLGQMGIVNYTVMEFGALEGIIACVASGIGITILPKAVVQLYKKKGILMHALPKNIALVKTIFITRKKQPVSKNTRLLIELIRQKNI